MVSHTDNKLETFSQVCNDIASESSYKKKVEVLETFLKQGTNNIEFTGDLILWFKMLIPGSSQRVYHMQNKQMIKLFSRLFDCDMQEMQHHLEESGDISETVASYFNKSKTILPQSESILTLSEVEYYLVRLSKLSKEEEQLNLFKTLCKKVTANDLKTIIRLIKQDLRINAGARHILDTLSVNAYTFYQSSRDLEAVVLHFSGNLKAKSDALKKNAKIKNNKAQVEVMVPISPMLANVCKSMDEAFKKCPNGIYSEVKYDGERVQIHKKGDHFKFFSRNLKPVMDHKIQSLQEKIPEAFPNSVDMILDSEIILIDIVTGELLPFGTLGVNKKTQYPNSQVCLFVFDCISYNGEDLTQRTFKERRNILENNIRPVKSFVQLSESHFIKSPKELSLMTAKVLKANLEGLVLKNPSGTYEPGKRGWLKLKKDYLFDGRMADTADLVVLGAWFGSGKKGGTLSIFLMGCYDKKNKLWKTVTKVHSGLDDVTNESVHHNLMSLMERSGEEIPKWLDCKKGLIPDLLAKDPFKMPVWEITGAEFTKSEAHTASGISIRFPRITKRREDKSANEANDLLYLEELYEKSKKDVNVDLLISESDTDSGSLFKAKQSTLDKTSSKRKPTDDELNEFILKASKSEHGPNEAIVQPTLKNLNLFKNYVAYFHDIPNKNILQKQFVESGGQIVEDSKLANVSFIGLADVYESLKNFRKTFKRTCRHLYSSWISDSIQNGALEKYSLYAVLCGSEYE